MDLLHLLITFPKIMFRMLLINIKDTATEDNHKLLNGI